MSGESLEGVLADHLLTPFGRCTCGAGDGVWGIDDDAPWRKHAAGVWREACTVRSVEELKKCPRGTVILDGTGKPFVRGPAEDGQDYWTSGEITLPALVLYRPDWSTP